MTFNVIEKFISIDGEGPTMGELATFIRFAGCNLNCSWCDTAYSIPMNQKCEMLSAEQICDYIKKSGVNNVTLTGGEPLMQQGIEELIDMLSKYSLLMIHIETNGSVPIYKFKKIRHLDNVRFILDYKLPSSDMEDRMDLLNYEELCSNDACKFVIENEQDLNRAKEIVDKYNLTEKCLVLFSPITSSIEPIKIVEFLKDNKLNKVRLQLQLHKIVWSPETRCV